MSHSTTKSKCPDCHQEVIKKSHGQCVVCQLCSKVKRRVFRFCCDCQREWLKTTPPDSACNQPNCALRAALLSDNRISDPNSSAYGCPYFRACPKCNALLTHDGEDCPEIECPKCSTEFCFCCLRPTCSPLNVDFDLIDCESIRQEFHDDDECTIVDNSQSLMALR